MSGCLLSLWLMSTVYARSPNVIVISLDTTRADALSCDEGSFPGFEVKPDAITPTLDELAAGGIRFRQFWANAPSTLNSHATMMTGLDPHGHAVVRNGTVMDRGLYTLAERLAEEGYDTIGVVAAAALEKAMAFHQGFRVYDDDTKELYGIMYQQRASGVVDRVFQRVDERKEGAPLFLFVHFYDPHTPYDPPPPFDTRFTNPDYTGPYREAPAKMGPLAQALLDGTADPEDSTYMNALYLGEVAYMDSQVGRLLEGLKQRDLLEETLLVVTADHGEVLSEDSFYAYSHGGDVTDGVMRIPLIMRAYGLPFPKGRIVNRQASLAGLAPTIERVLGLEMRLGDRRDFWDLIRPGPVRVDEGWPERGTEPVFMEASRPRQMEPETGWNNRLFYRSVRAGGYSMVGAPVFEIPYTLSGTEEGGEGLLLWLRYMMARWDSIAPTLRVDTPMAPSTKKALEALGYLE